MANKVNSKIWSLVNNIEPGVSKNITWLDAYDKLASWGGFEIGLEHLLDGHTILDIWIDNKKVHTINLGPESWDHMHRDWEWSVVCSTVLDYIFDSGLIKKPRARRKDAKVKTPNKAVKNSAKLAQISQDDVNVNNYMVEEEIDENSAVYASPQVRENKIKDLKRKLGNLSVKKSTHKKQGKDITPIEQEVDDIKRQIELWTIK